MHGNTPRCKSAKLNFCSVCCKKVNRKNGLQCESACRRWTHYNCLDIPFDVEEDLKKGSIRIRCPCPQCNSTQGHDGSASSTVRTTPRCTTSTRTSSLNATSCQTTIPTECKTTSAEMPAKLSSKMCPICAAKTDHDSPKCVYDDSRSSTSVGCPPRRPCPTPVEYGTEELCCVILDITKELNGLMKKLKSVLAHQDKCLREEFRKRRKRKHCTYCDDDDCEGIS